MTVVLAALLIIGRLLIAAVFAVAGLAKLADREGTRTMVVGFGVPGRVVGAVAIALPIAELTVAGLLLPASTAAYGAISAVALLVIFSAAIAWNLARGRSPDCHCFGQLHSAPAGWWTLARNALLAAAAGLVAVASWNDPGPGAFGWIAELDGAGLVAVGLALALAVALTVGSVVLLHLLRSYGLVLTRLERVEQRLGTAGLDLDEPDDMPQLGLAPGTTAPAFWLPSTAGDRVSLGDLLLPGRPVLLLFTSATCGPCSVLLPEVALWQREHADELTVALLSDGDPELVLAEAVEHGLVNVLVDETLSAYESYGANGTPSAVLVGDDGSIASWVAAGPDWIATLVDEVLDAQRSVAGLPVGSEIPSIPLSTPAGEEIDLRDAVREPTVILFWNPGCGFCRAMHGDVKAWEQRRPDGAPGLLVVSAGAVDEVRNESFSSVVLLDPEWTASTALGATGTPMAMLVDGDGRVASPLVTGAAAALELLAAHALSAAS